MLHIMRDEGERIGGGGTVTYPFPGQDPALISNRLSDGLPEAGTDADEDRIARHVNGGLSEISMFGRDGLPSRSIEPGQCHL